MIRQLCIVLVVSAMVCVFNSHAQDEELEREHEQSSLYHRTLLEQWRTQDAQHSYAPANPRTIDREYVRRRQALKNNESPALQSSTTPALIFHPIGPGNVGGRTDAFAIDYAHPNIMIAGGATGGLWRSFDAGSTWTRVSDLNDIQNVSCLAQDPKHSNIWYAGTGEVLSTTERRTSNNLRTICTGSGIYKSIDNGVHWARISPEQKLQPNTLVDPFQATWRLVATGDTVGTELYAACYGGIYRLNAGVFSRIATDNMYPPFCSEIAMSADQKTLFAAYSADESGVNSKLTGVWRSDDSGKTWQNISPLNFPSGARRVCLALAPSNPAIAYLMVQIPTIPSQRYQSFSSQHFLWQYDSRRLADQSWMQRSQWLDSVHINTLAGYAQCMAVYPTDENTVFVAGTDLYRSSSGCEDENDGVHLGGYPYTVEPGFLHPDLHCLQFSPTAPYRLYAAGDGGMAYTEEPLAMFQPYWKTLNNGYDVTQCYRVSQDQFDLRDSLVCVSLQDNSNYINKWPGRGSSWTFCGGGDGTCNQVCAGGETVYASSQYASSIYAFGVDANSQPIYYGFQAPSGSYTIATPFVTTFRLHARPVRKDTILVYAIGTHLFHFDQSRRASEFGNDTGLVWKEWTSVNALLPDTTFICTLGFSATNEDMMYVACTNGMIYSINTVGNSAFVKKLPTLPVRGFPSSIDCNADGSLIASISNYNCAAIFRCDETTQVWQNISDELRIADSTGYLWGPSIRCVRFYTDPQKHSEYLLAGTSTGIFSAPWKGKKDGAWELLSSGAVGTVIVEDLDIRAADGRVLVGTHGAGVYESSQGDDTNGIDTSTTAFFDLLQNFPNPVRTGTIVRYRLDSGSSVRLELFDAMGKSVQILVDDNQEAGWHQVEIGSELLKRVSDGIYFYRLIAGGHRQSRILSLSR